MLDDESCRVQEPTPLTINNSDLCKMAAFLRGKQAGIQRDLSDGILPGLFAPDDQARYGINSQIGSVTLASNVPI
jgi:hypothetical protein